MGAVVLAASGKHLTSGWALEQVSDRLLPAKYPEDRITSRCRPSQIPDADARKGEARRGGGLPEPAVRASDRAQALEQGGVGADLEDNAARLVAFAEHLATGEDLAA